MDGGPGDDFLYADQDALHRFAGSHILIGGPGQDALYALRQNGMVTRFSTAGTTPSSASGQRWIDLPTDHGRVESIALDVRSGVLYALADSGTLLALDPTRSGYLWLEMRDGVLALDQGANTQSHVLTSEADLYRIDNDLGENWTFVATMKEMVQDSNGQVFILETSGKLQRWDGSNWVVLHENVRKMFMADGGTRLYYLTHDNYVHRVLWQNGGLWTSGDPVWANTQDFDIDANGSLFWLGTGGLLQRSTGNGWLTLAENATELFLTHDGTLYVMDLSGQLFVQRPGGTLTLILGGTDAAGRWETLTPNDVKLLKVEVHDHQGVFALGDDHIIYINGQSSSGWGEVSNFWFTEDGRYLYLVGLTGGFRRHDYQLGRWETHAQ